MNEHSCCKGRLTSSRPDGPRSSVRRVTKITSFLLSSVTLILMPKCPICVAAYATLLTGISVSTGVAGHLRMGLIVACTSVLVFLALHGLTKAIKNPGQKKPPCRP